MCLPSVTGDGEAKFCFWWRRLPVPVSRRQRIEPSFRLIASSNSLSRLPDFFVPEPPREP